MRISDWSSDVALPIERRVIDRARGARTQAEIDSERHRAADPDIGAGLDVREGASVKPVAAQERPHRDEQGGRQRLFVGAVAAALPAAVAPVAKGRGAAQKDRQSVV